MKSALKLMILANACFVALYVLSNWAEYSQLQSDVNQFGNPMAISMHFPWYIHYSGGGTVANPGMFTFIDSNFTLWLFLLATVVNLYLAFRLQRTIKTKQNPSLTKTE
jgi:hypothetical protein